MINYAVSGATACFGMEVFANAESVQDQVRSSGLVVREDAIKPLSGARILQSKHQVVVTSNPRVTASVTCCLV